MTSIQISELDTLEASVMKYIVYNLGLNIRPGNAQFVENNNFWRVPLNVIIPHTVSNRNGRQKTFLYSFDNVGIVELEEKENDKFTVRHATKADILDEEIISRFADLTALLEYEILEAGKSSWGKLSWIATFLRPLYHIITNILVREQVPIEYIQEKGYSKYVKLLIDEDFVNPDQSKSYLVATNKLTVLAQTAFKTVTSEFDIAQLVVGMVFAKRYSTIKNDMQIYAPSAYVDAAKAYYTDAIQYGEIISISEEELYKKFIRLGKRQVLTMAEFSFMTLISELVSANLLHRERDEIMGVQQIFDKALLHKDKIMSHITEVNIETFAT